MDWTSAVYQKEKPTLVVGFIFSCGVGRDRTGDTRIFSPLLYRLSYRTFGEVSRTK